MKAKYFILLFLCSFGCVQDDSNSAAYTWFGRPNYAFDETTQKYWIGTTNDTEFGTTQHICQYDLIADTFITTKLGSIYEKDDHNQTQILIRNQDKRLIAFYTEHNGKALRYRISINPLDSQTWSKEYVLEPFESYSYISPYQSSNGEIFIFFRVRTGSVSTWYFMKSSDGAVTFGPPTLLFEAGPTHNYLISYQSKDLVHFAASNGHPQSNPDLNINTYHFFFDLLTEQAHGSDSAILVLPLSPDKLTAVNLTKDYDTGWILDITVKDNLPRIIFIHYPDGRISNTLIKELWFTKWDGERWLSPIKIARTMKGYIEDDFSIDERAYSGASRFDTSNPDIIWMPMQVKGVLELHRVDLSKSPIQIDQITFDSEVDNWRPISVPTIKNNLIWLRKDKYEMYTDYSLQLQFMTIETR